MRLGRGSPSVKHEGARSWSASTAAGVPARAGGVAEPLRTMFTSLM